MIPTTASSFYNEVHGTSNFLSRDSIIDFAEKYYARKLQEATTSQMNDTYFNHEEPRKKPTVNLGISDIP